MKKILTLLGLVLTFVAVNAQNGEIAGKVLDENGEGVPSANVVLVDAKGVSTGRGTVTDFDGNYSIKPLTPGKYNVMYSYVGYNANIQQGVVVNADKPTWVNANLKPSTTELEQVEIVSYKVPLIDPAKTSSQNIVSQEEIATMATKSVADIAATTAGAFQSDQGGGINVKGGRDNGTQYYIDGVKVTGVPTVPATAIQELQVITGGIPAKYGDVTGGIVNITSRGPSSNFTGSAEYQTTQGLDAYGWNLANANITGPILKLKKSKKTIIGFFAAFEFLSQKDPRPSAVGVWQVRQDVLDQLRVSPLLKKETETGFDLRSDNVTFADMYLQKVKPNTSEINYRGNGRIDIRPVDNITLAFGGSATYRKYHDWVEQYTLFNSENNPQYTDLNWRVYGRFTHNIQSKAGDDDKKKKSSAFQNAYYSIQVDYEKYFVKFYDDTHGDNPFDYGYIGKFETQRAPIYARDTFMINGVTLNGWKQAGFADTAISFTPGTKNVYGSAYTQQFYELLGATRDANGTYNLNNENTDFLIQSLAIQSGGNDQSGALINGQRGSFVNSTWYNTGRQYNGLGIDNDNDQYRVRVEGAFDLLKQGAPSRNKHSIEFGVEFEQRIQRSYSVSPLGLWQRARQLTNQQLQTQDYSNPTLRINGVDYTFDDPNRPAFFDTDTIRFNRAYVDTAQRFFDKSLRTKLGKPVDGTEFIDIDALDPSQLSLDLFSPEELLGDGANLVAYRGYDPYGNRLTKQPSFNDFFTKRRADGELERAIGAYSPIYAAAYISDRFYFKDLTFNVGLRVDRFDANQKVLKDQYSLYPIYTKGEVGELGGNAITHPSNIGEDYYVYVDNVKAPNVVAGYRNGGTWYDRFGNELTSGKEVADASASGQIQPYLKDPNANIKDPDTFDPNGTFEDYKPKVIVMPRLQFSFNLTDKALFFAHYDILSQRPGAQVIMNPMQYLYFSDNIGALLNNPNLKPERTIDFELGFKQKVSNTSAVTISAFYREFRDQIQVRKIVNAYPKDYMTYDNIDFGTTKGFTLDFDMRRTGNFTLKANYTMQFAEGTGSNSTTQLNLVNSNQPNFRAINPLNYDSRHLINITTAFSFLRGRDYNGPVVKNKQFLADAGISLQLTTRSGTPYTAQLASTPDGQLTGGGRPISTGSINGSRLPWYFRLNMRVWKGFQFNVGKKEENKRPLGFEIYLQIQNLLNTKNVIDVYRYTGTPNDNGYLSDPANLPAIESYLNPQAFRDQYTAYVNRSANYSLPRRIYLGITFNF